MTISELAAVAKPGMEFKRNGSNCLYYFDQHEMLRAKGPGGWNSYIGLLSRDRLAADEWEILSIMPDVPVTVRTWSMVDDAARVQAIWEIIKPISSVDNHHRLGCKHCLELVEALIGEMKWQPKSMKLDHDTPDVVLVNILAAFTKLERSGLCSRRNELWNRVQAELQGYVPPGKL